MRAELALAPTKNTCAPVAARRSPVHHAPRSAMQPPPAVAVAKRVRALERDIKRHDLSSGDALVELACLLLYNDHVPKDVPRALQLLERAIAQYDVSDAFYHLATYFCANGSRAQKRRVVPLLERAVCRFGDAHFFYLLGCVLYSGDTGERDVNTGFQLLERAVAIELHPQHMETLAAVMLRDARVHADYKRALKMYKEAIRLSNNAWRMFRLANFYADGTYNLKPCMKCAKKWYERAIEVGDLPKAKVRLAYILRTCENEQYHDSVRAAALLEQALSQAPDEETLVQAGNLYAEDKQLSNYSRAKQMYQRAMDEFDCRTAMMFLLGLYILGHIDVPPDYKAALDFCTVHYERTKDSAVLYMLVCLLWSGSDQVPQNRHRAYELCQNEKNDTHAVQASLLRYGSEGVMEADLKLARTLCEGKKSVNAMLTYAIILSESSSRCDLKRAEKMLRNIVKGGENFYAWIPLSLRRSAYDLPVDGNPTRVLRCMRRVTNCSSLAALNLVSLLLEKPGGKDESMHFMEYLVKETKEVLLTSLNMAYLWLGGIASFFKDPEGAVSILEGIVEEDGDRSARAMLAGALVVCERDCERSAQLWKGVKQECGDDEEEFLTIRQLVSGQALRKLEDVT